MFRAKRVVPCPFSNGTSQVDSIIEDLDWYISQAGDDIHLIEKFEAEDSYDLYEALELDELAAPGAPPVVKGSKKLDVSVRARPA